MHQTFHWSESAAVLAKLCASAKFALDKDSTTFVAPGLRVSVPKVFPRPPGLVPFSYGEATAQELATHRSKQASLVPQTDPLAHFLAHLPACPPAQCMILIQAGAVSMAYFQAGEAVATKTIKRYVVRGRGRAQPTYLSTKGKSRYGSRLRLQNALLLLEETNTKLNDYWQRFGDPAQIFVSSPARLWSDLFRAKPAPPFERSHAFEPIAMDLPAPTTDVLLRAYKALSYGRVERS